MSGFLFLGHATIKVVTTILIALATDLVSNIFGKHSGWKQEILALALCLIPRECTVLRVPEKVPWY
jgi:hypothetical protein